MDKKTWIVVFGVLVFSASVFLAWWTVKRNSSPGLLGCNQELEKYVSSETKTVNECLEVVGVVDSVIPLPNSSYQIRLKPDPEFSYLINQINVDYHGGDLVAEVICAFLSQDTEAARKCEGYENRIVIPPAGQRVKMRGRYGLDVLRGWAVVSPVSAIEILN
jgi:hypothetical protein